MPSIRDLLAKKKSKLALPKEKSNHLPAILNNYHEGSFYNVDIDLIKPNPDQPRQFFDPDALAELSQSIKEKGVLQPVIIRKDEDSNIIHLVAGERRLRAAKQAGLTKMPAIITKGNPIEISLIENLQRENLTSIEEAEALRRMTEEYNYTQEQLALAIGKARTTITEALSLNKLPEEIKDECRRADIYSRRILVEVAKQKTPEARSSLFRKIKQGNLKSDQVREITRKKVKKTHRTPSTPTATSLDRILRLSRHLTKVDLNTAKKTEKIRLVTELKKLREIIDRLIG